MLVSANEKPQIFPCHETRRPCHRSPGDRHPFRHHRVLSRQRTRIPEPGTWPVGPGHCGSTGKPQSARPAGAGFSAKRISPNCAPISTARPTRYSLQARPAESRRLDEHRSQRRACLVEKQAAQRTTRRGDPHRHWTIQENDPKGASQWALEYLSGIEFNNALIRICEESARAGTGSKPPPGSPPCPPAGNAMRPWKACFSPGPPKIPPRRWDSLKKIRAMTSCPRFSATQPLPAGRRSIRRPRCRPA